jgi:hypothetical protein
MEGYQLGLELAGLLTPVLGSAAASLFGVESIDDQVDLNSAAKELGQLPQRLLSLDAGKPEKERLVFRLMAKTRRVADGKNGVYLNTNMALSQAYAGGNYGEFFRAVWWVLTINYAPFGTEGRGVMETLREMLQKLLGNFNLMASVSEIMPTQDENSSGADAAASG